MEQLTIKTAEPNGTWDRNGKTFHQIKVCLSDGTTGEVNATTPDRWSVGDEVVVVEKKDGPFGVKLKLDKPGYGNRQTRQQGRNPQIETQWAINAAISVFAARAYANFSIEDIEQLARELLATRDKIIAQ